MLHFNLIPAGTGKATKELETKLVHSDLPLDVNDGAGGMDQSPPAVIRIQSSEVPWLGLLRLENAVALLREAEVSCILTFGFVFVILLSS